MIITLIVEDEPTILALAEGLVSALGHRTLTAYNGTEALALVEGGESIDLLFTDINLGEDPDGLKLARAVRRKLHDLKVLYTSGQTLTDGMQKLMVEKSAFLPKPYTPEDLRSSICSLVTSCDYIS